jgi:hypothetical protein
VKQLCTTTSLHTMPMMQLLVSREEQNGMVRDAHPERNESGWQHTYSKAQRPKRNAI